MLTAAARRSAATLRRPDVSIRIARALWIVWAFLAWNVVFDHVIVVAGREYIGAATTAAASTASPGRPHQYENMDDWMRPAVTRALWTASASATAIALSGLALVGAAGYRAAREQVMPCA